MSTMGNPPGSGSSRGQNPVGRRDGGPSSGGSLSESTAWARSPQTPATQPPSSNTSANWSAGASQAAELARLGDEIKNLHQAIISMQSTQSHVHLIMRDLPKSIAEQLRTAAGADQQRVIDSLTADLERARADREEAERLAVEAMSKAEQTEKQAWLEAQQASAKAQAEARQAIARAQAEAQHAIQKASEELKAETGRLQQNPLLPLILSIQDRIEAAMQHRTVERLAGAMQERRPDLPDLYQKADRFAQQVQELKPALERVCGGALQGNEYQRLFYECRGVSERARQLDTVPAPPRLQLTVTPVTTGELVADGRDGPTLSLGAWSIALEQEIKLQVAEYQTAVEQAVRACATEAWPEELRTLRRRLTDSARNLHMLVFNALVQTSDGPETQQLLEQVNKAVEGVGITPVVPRGEKYDAYEHELAGTVSSPGQKGRVVQVELPGYREGNRMLYKPRVIVSD